jgi:nicotinate phosphoribosyltransferase
VVLPGQKQIFRIDDDDVAQHDVLACDDEVLPGRPLLRPVMKNGIRLPAGKATLDESRTHAESELRRLPAHLRATRPPSEPYKVLISKRLQDARDTLQRVHSE